MTEIQITRTRGRKAIATPRFGVVSRKTGFCPPRKPRRGMIWVIRIWSGFRASDFEFVSSACSHVQGIKLPVIPKSPDSFVLARANELNFASPVIRINHQVCEREVEWSPCHSNAFKRATIRNPATGVILRRFRKVRY